MNIEDLVCDKRLKDILNNYSDGEKLGNVLCTMIENRRDNEIIIPVLGLQGMGKSTLINSILSEDILPNDADETTCVPVEIKYGEVEKGFIYFQDSKNVIEVFTREDLNKYVDNMNNNGNKKKVLKIILYRNIEILKYGITIVDLPGVGSLTKENEETTMKYIKNLCTAIFVIPTTPTIRRREEIFIKSVWMQFSSAIFVQNNFGESKREIEESLEFNTKILKNIGKSIKTLFNNEIIVVNAYEALLGKLNQNIDMVETSNINSLTQKIYDFALNWNISQEKNIRNRVKLLIDASKKQIQKYIDETLMSEDELHMFLEIEEDNFKSNIDKIKVQIEDIEEFLEDKEEDIKRFARNQAKKCTENIRVDIFRLIDKGIVDGDLLTDSFNDIQNKYISTVLDDFYDFKSYMINQIEEKIEPLYGLIDFKNEILISQLNFNNGDAFKFEKGLKIGIDITGSIGAIYAIGVLGGPIGVIGSGLAGIAIGLVTSIVGKKIKKEITNSRGRETKREIDKVIDQVGDEIKTKLSNGFEDLLTKVNDCLNTYLYNCKKEFTQIKSRNIQKKKSEFKNIYNLNTLKNDCKYLEKKVCDIDE